MRKFLNPRLERGEVRIEDIELDHKCRDDLSAILIGIQYLYSQEDLRERLFTLYRPSKLQCFGKINRFLDETT